MLSLLSTTQVGLMGKLWFSSGVMWAVCWQSMGSFVLPFYLQRVSVVRLGAEPKYVVQFVYKLLFLLLLLVHQPAETEVLTSKELK